MFVFVFFFFKQKTAYEMRISDWSSDVCSSDLSVRLFVVDTTAFSNDEDLSGEERKALKDFKRVFVNANIEEETGTEWAFNEGCLSIPDIREDVSRDRKSVV